MPVESTMQYRALFVNTHIAACVLLGVACDEAARETPTPSPVLAGATVEPSAKLDLQAVVDVVASGEVEDAEALEKRLAVDTVAHVDLDEDGKRDELRIVERRVDEQTVFEIRAVPSSKAEIDVELAPAIATLTLEPKPEDGRAIARARYTSSFALVAKVDADATIEHTFTGLAIEVDGKLRVEPTANVFVSWAFRVGRPVYVAELFIVTHDVPDRDPCWPPGHCKHGHWKAQGDRKHQRRDDTALVRVVIDTDHGHHKHHGPKKGKHKKHKKHK